MPAANCPESFILGMLRYGALANALEAQRLGAQAYLVKPLDFAEVNQWIQRYLTGLVVDQNLIATGIHFALII